LPFDSSLTATQIFSSEISYDYINQNKQKKGEMTMTKKILAFLLTVCLAVSIMGVSLAEFDYSVFEDNEQFEFDVEIDVRNDAHIVSFPEDFNPIDRGEGTADVAVVGKTVTMSLLGISDKAVTFCIEIEVSGWPNCEEIILLPDKTSYTVKIENGQESLQMAKVGEAVTTIPYERESMLVTSELFPMFDEIIEKQITSVKYRLNGDDDIDGDLAINVEQLKLLMDLYKEAGGMEQDFDFWETRYPVTVK
jgi:hypothetical protein